METTPETFDVAVIGGGPAGMMAAGRAAERGLRVILLEKNPILGKKLLITGGGRCNVTNNEPDNRIILARFKEGGKYLASTFAQWNVENTLSFFHKRNMPTVTEKEQRVFPETHKAQSVHDVLVAYMREHGVTVRTNAAVQHIASEGSRITQITLKGGMQIHARSVILATGGVSRPETGSTGDGFRWLTKLSHAVSDTTGALVPLVSHDAWVHRLAGVSLPNAKITAFLDGVKQESRIGKVLFTHVGLSGPGILNFSRAIGELLQYGTVTLSLDILPDMGPDKVNEMVHTHLRTEGNKMVKNSLSDILPSPLVVPLLALAGINADTFGHSVRREERLALVRCIKGMTLTVDSLLGLDKAIITSGGVSLDDIDFKTMRSRKYDNLFIVGDLLNIDRPSGGFSLQICWSTGFVAGSHA